MRKIIKILQMGPMGIIRRVAHRICFGKLFSLLEKVGLHVLPVHFYSPVPDTRELRKNMHQWNREWDFSGIDFRIGPQRNLLKDLHQYLEEPIPEYSIVEDMNLGEGYGVVESHILYGMIRYFKPQKIIEVGSGISTYYALNALKKNSGEEEKKIEITCIEPFPREGLRSLAADPILTFMPIKLQNTNLEFFKTLRENDIVFIDSTHISKINSDVDHLYLEILPNLNPGVIIHIHDIPFPFLTSADVEFWIFKKHQFWNEAMLLKAFLSFNESFEILLCSSYLHCKYPEELRSALSLYDPVKHFPSSLWLKRIQ